MDVTIRPSQIKGPAQAPPGKSMAHRLMICAALAEGRSVLRCTGVSEDILATRDCLEALGARIRGDGDSRLIDGSFPSAAAGTEMNCRESGSTLRFMIPLCAVSGNRVTLHGSDRLMERPLSVYEEIFEQQGNRLERIRTGSGTAVRVNGKLQPGEFTVDGSISSQFISGLLFALPLLQGDSVIRLVPPVESRSYIDMTIDALAGSGIRIEWQDGLTIRIPGGQKYKCIDTTVEGDWSNSAFFLAMGAEVTGLDRNSLQGDRICEDYFSSLRRSRAILDISDCPDLGPVLMAYAAMHHGAELTGTARLRIKESDRGAAMKEELAKFGVSADIRENSITVGTGLRKPEAPLCGHNDHRIVMALTVLCAAAGGVIQGAEAVDKSFPGFFEACRSLGLDMDISN